MQCLRNLPRKVPRLLQTVHDGAGLGEGEGKRGLGMGFHRLNYTIFAALRVGFRGSEWFGG